jgi:hypothetical protein
MGEVIHDDEVVFGPGLNADGKEEQWYLSTWRIAPFGRFWQA